MQREHAEEPLSVACRNCDARAGEPCEMGPLTLPTHYIRVEDWRDSQAKPVQSDALCGCPKSGREDRRCAKPRGHEDDHRAALGDVWTNGGAWTGTATSSPTTAAKPCPRCSRIGPHSEGDCLLGWFGSDLRKPLPAFVREVRDEPKYSIGSRVRFRCALPDVGMRYQVMAMHVGVLEYRYDLVHEVPGERDTPEWVNESDLVPATTPRSARPGAK
jgi:hypothetical protein